jgi:hypothetical protein
LQAAVRTRNLDIIDGIVMHGAGRQTLNPAGRHVIARYRARLTSTNIATRRVAARVIAVRPTISSTGCSAVTIEIAVAAAREAAIVRVVAGRRTLVATARIARMGGLRTRQVAAVTAILVTVRVVRTAILAVDTVHLEMASTPRDGESSEFEQRTQ